jgi:hypothetical protein
MKFAVLRWEVGRSVGWMEGDSKCKLSSSRTLNRPIHFSVTKSLKSRNMTTIANETIFSGELNSEDAQKLAEMLNELSEDNPEVLSALVQEAEEILTSEAQSQSVEVEPLATTSFDAIALAEYEYRLGKMQLPNEHRVHRVGWSVKIQSRKVHAEVFVKFKHPSIDRFVNDAIACAITSAGASVIAGVATGAVPAAFAAFYPAWKVCMAAKVGLTVANDMKVELYTKKTYSGWG